MALYEDLISGTFKEILEDEIDISLIYKGKIIIPYEYKFEIDYKDEKISGLTFSFSINKIEYLEYFADFFTKLKFDFKEAKTVLNDKLKKLYFQFVLKDEVISNLKQKIQPIEVVDNMVNITDSAGELILFDLSNYKINFIRVEQITLTA